MLHDKTLLQRVHLWQSKDRRLQILNRASVVRLILHTELCIFPLNGGTGLCSQAEARSCVEHSRNVWHPISYTGCTLGGWCHKQKKTTTYIWADINHTQGQQECSVKALQSRFKLNGKTATVVQTTTISKFSSWTGLFFFFSLFFLFDLIFFFLPLASLM